MTTVSKGDDNNNALFICNLHAPPLPALPFELIEEILCRLPVKHLLQLRCVCKSWNSLISNPNFAKKHLRLSTTRHIHTLSFSNLSRKFVLTTYPLHSIFTNVTTNATQLEYPPNNYDEQYPRKNLDYIVGSCDGILCLAEKYRNFVLLWNPSTRKFKELPPYQRPQTLTKVLMTYGFGYDHVTDNYKVVVVLQYFVSRFEMVEKTEVRIHTLGTNFWKSIQEFPFGGVPIEQSGIHVSGTINWLACKYRTRENSPCLIVSLNLGNESYQEVLQPDYGEVDSSNFLTLGVLRNCLCMISDHDVWVMKEYGNKESWTKLFTVSYMRDPSKCYYFDKAVYIFDDNQVLLNSIGDWRSKLVLYNSRNSAFKFIIFLSNNLTDLCINIPEICVESLICP